MNIIADIKAWIETELPNLYAPMTIDNFAKEADAIMIRGDPSTARVIEFVDGSSTGSQQITFYARNVDAAKAISALGAIYKKFNQPEISLSEVSCIRVTQSTLPAFVEVDNGTMASVYSLTVNVDFDGANSVGV